MDDSLNNTKPHGSQSLFNDFKTEDELDYSVLYLNFYQSGMNLVASAMEELDKKREVSSGPGFCLVGTPGPQDVCSIYASENPIQFEKSLETKTKMDRSKPPETAPKINTKVVSKRIDYLKRQIGGSLDVLISDSKKRGSDEKSADGRMEDNNFGTEEWLRDQKIKKRLPGLVSELLQKAPLLMAAPEGGSKEEATDSLKNWLDRNTRKLNTAFSSDYLDLPSKVYLLENLSEDLKDIVYEVVLEDPGTVTKVRANTPVDEETFVCITGSTAGKGLGAVTRIGTPQQWGSLDAVAIVNGDTPKTEYFNATNSSKNRTTSWTSGSKDSYLPKYPAEKVIRTTTKKDAKAPNPGNAEYTGLIEFGRERTGTGLPGELYQEIKPELPAKAAEALAGLPPEEVKLTLNAELALKPYTDPLKESVAKTRMEITNFLWETDQVVRAAGKTARNAVGNAVDSGEQVVRRSLTRAEMALHHMVDGATTTVDALNSQIDELVNRAVQVYSPEGLALGWDGLMQASQNGEPLKPMVDTINTSAKTVRDTVIGGLDAAENAAAGGAKAIVDAFNSARQAGKKGVDTVVGFFNSPEDSPKAGAEATQEGFGSAIFTPLKKAGESVTHFVNGVLLKFQDGKPWEPVENAFDDHTGNISNGIQEAVVKTERIRRQLVALDTLLETAANNGGKGSFDIISGINPDGTVPYRLQLEYTRDALEAKRNGDLGKLNRKLKLFAPDGSPPKANLINDESINNNLTDTLAPDTFISEEPVEYLSNETSDSPIPCHTTKAYFLLSNTILLRTSKDTECRLSLSISAKRGFEEEKQFWMYRGHKDSKNIQFRLLGGFTLDNGETWEIRKVELPLVVRFRPSDVKPIIKFSEITSSQLSDDDFLLMILNTVRKNSLIYAEHIAAKQCYLRNLVGLDYINACGSSLKLQFFTRAYLNIFLNSQPVANTQ